MEIGFTTVTVLTDTGFVEDLVGAVILGVTTVAGAAVVADAVNGLRWLVDIGKLEDVLYAGVNDGHDTNADDFAVILMLIETDISLFSTV